MKILIPVLFLLTAWLPAQHMNLENVIEHAARAVEEDLPQGTRVAVLNFTSASDEFTNHVMEKLNERLTLGRKVSLVDPQVHTLVGQLMNLQASRELSDRSAQTIGQMLGVRSIISGNLTSFGTFYRFRVRVIDVETASVQTQVSFELGVDTEVLGLLGNRSMTAFEPVIMTVPIPTGR